jgi:hypothetical protein
MRDASKIFLGTFGDHRRQKDQSYTAWSDRPDGPGWKERSKSVSRSVKRWTAVAALTVLGAVAAWAAPVDGKWTWTQMRQDQQITYLLELKQGEGEKLTGTITMGEQKSEIRDGTIKGADVAFLVVREVNGNQIKVAYKGKLEGDKITGTGTVTFGGEERPPREWVANRVK